MGILRKNSIAVASEPTASATTDEKLHQKPA